MRVIGEVIDWCFIDEVWCWWKVEVLVPVEKNRKGKRWLKYQKDAGLMR